MADLYGWVVFHNKFSILVVSIQFVLDVFSHIFIMLYIYYCNSMCICGIKMNAHTKGLNMIMHWLGCFIFGWYALVWQQLVFLRLGENLPLVCGTGLAQSLVMDIIIHARVLFPYFMAAHWSGRDVELRKRLLGGGCSCSSVGSTSVFFIILLLVACSVWSLNSSGK